MLLRLIDSLLLSTSLHSTSDTSRSTSERFSRDFSRMKISSMIYDERFVRESIFLSTASFTTLMITDQPDLRLVNCKLAIILMQLRINSRTS